MDKLVIKGTWHEIAGKLKQQFANITDDDILLEDGKEEEFLGKIQIKLGKTKEEVLELISNLK